MRTESQRDIIPERGVVNEQVILAFEQLPTMQGISFLVALVLVFTVRNAVPASNSVVWLVMILAVVVSRIVLYQQFQQARKTPFAGAWWEKAFLVLCLLSGLAWGVSAFLILPAGDHGLTAFFVLVMASLSAATTISHSSLQFAAALWSVPAMLLYAVRCVMVGGELEYTIGLLILLYLFTIVSHAQKHHRAITSSISLKFENLMLVDELRRANEILRRSSSRDGLTGLANRAHLDEFFDREWRRAMREHRPLSLIMLDIDHFKLFNDNYGHLAGDECLKKVASVLTGMARRPADLAARYGGEEFILVLPDAERQGALEIAEKLRGSVEHLQKPHAHSPVASVVTVSVGVASTVPAHGADGASLISLVDTALYAAKHAGRNQVVVA